jgi:hypothetical protein
MKIWGVEITKRNLEYKERWFLAYNETFEDWNAKNWANGDIIIPSCVLEDVWNEQGIPTTLITIEYNGKITKIYR